MGQLSKFLREQKDAFLKDVHSGSTKDWTVVMGNEAGDLDTAASSIAYSYLSTIFQSKRTVALLLTERKDLKLRAENLSAYQRAGLADDHQDLLCINDLPDPIPTFSKLALVDHNKLTSVMEGKGKVVGVIDHHEDEGLYHDADPRVIVVPTGSCTSLVTQYFRPAWEKETAKVPGEVASLLLSAILVDTGALKPHGKAQDVDRESASFLMPLAGISTSPSALSSDPSAIPEEATELFTKLIEEKMNVSSLSTRDLLRRDYKQYFLSSKVHVGLSTVPLGLKAWLEKDPQMWHDVEEWIAEKGLDLAGVLTTFRNDKGKHRRELALVVRNGGDERLKNLLWEGVEGSDVLKVERKEGMEGKSMLEGQIRIWQQKNSDATRKQVAPLLTSIVQRYTGEPQDAN